MRAQVEPLANVRVQVEMLAVGGAAAGCDATAGACCDACSPGAVCARERPRAKRQHQRRGAADLR